MRMELRSMNWLRQWHGPRVSYRPVKRAKNRSIRLIAELACQRGRLANQASS
jgi:hypothetical protein